jgi:hypothetical protein
MSIILEDDETDIWKRKMVRTARGKITASMIPALCTYLVTEHKINPFTKHGKILLHSICFLVIGKCEIGDDIVVVARSHGPHVVAVEKWRKSLIRCKY